MPPTAPDSERDRRPEPVITAGVWVGVAVVVAVVHGALWALYYQHQPKVLWGDEDRYLTAALKLLQGDPSWHPGYLWPPLYPRFVAGALAVGRGSLIAVQVLQTVLLGVAGIIAGDLCRRLSGSVVAGLTAGVLVVAFPPLTAFAHYLWPEVLHLFLWIAALWLLVARSRSLAWITVAGVTLGLALLTKSLLMPFVPVLMVVSALGDTKGGRAGGAQRLTSLAGVGRATTMVMAMGLTVAPAVATTYRATGLLMISDSSAFNLWVGLNDRNRKAFVDEIVHPEFVRFKRSAPTFAERNDILRGRIRALLQERTLTHTLGVQLGRQYFRLLDKDSYLTEQLPSGLAFDQGRGYSAEPRALAAAVRRVSYLVYVAVLVLTPLGFVVWRYRPRRWLVVLMLFLAYNLAVFCWLHATPRYRVQLLPVLFMGCGGAVAWLAMRCREGVASRLRLGVGAALAVLLLFLAFAGPYL